MSSHMIGLLTGLGVAASAVVWIAALRGVGQSAARFAEVVRADMESKQARGVSLAAYLNRRRNGRRRADGR